MRDILVTLIVFASLPFIMRRPANGALVWVWLSVMRPHMLAWGFASSFPFALLVALCTTFSMLFSRRARTLPLLPPLLALAGFGAWTCITVTQAATPGAALAAWSTVIEMLIMTFICTMLLQSRRDIERLVWVLVFSLGFYGIAGAIAMLCSAGGTPLSGPPGSFIADSNAIALALIMTIPLLAWLWHTAQHRWLRRAVALAALLCAVAALGASSRGGLLAIGAMAAYAWRRRGLHPRAIAALLLTAPLLMLLVPGQEPDAAAHARLQAWAGAFALARSHLFGAGFALPGGHSIYFQVLGEHGFIGLLLYLFAGALTWHSATLVIDAARSQAALAWACSLATVVQASLAAFAVGGAFIGLAYFDVPYYLAGIVVALRAMVEQQLAQVRGVPCKSPFQS